MTTPDYEHLNDVGSTAPPTPKQVRAQAKLVTARARIATMHFHQETVGRGVGQYVSHVHADDAIGHMHSGKQAYPKQPDGGYWQKYGPSLGTTTPSPGTLPRLSSV